jgi:ABC-type transporter Mla MlaB component
MRDSDGASRVDSKAMALMIQIREHCGGEPLNAHQATVLFNLAQKRDRHADDDGPIVRQCG